MSRGCRSARATEGLGATVDMSPHEPDVGCLCGSVGVGALLPVIGQGEGGDMLHPWAATDSRAGYTNRDDRKVAAPDRARPPSRCWWRIATNARRSGSSAATPPGSENRTQPLSRQPSLQALRPRRSKVVASSGPKARPG